MRTLVLRSALVAALAAGVEAQILEPSGIPDLGSSTSGFFVTAPLGSVTPVFLGSGLLNPPIPVPGVGSLWILPPLLPLGSLTSGGFLSTTIPSDPTLLGQDLPVQGATVVPSPFSITATNALRVRIGPPPSVSPGSSAGNFGVSVAAGNVAGGPEAEFVAGAWSVGTGSAYVYSWSGGAASLLATLSPPSAQIGQYFGHSIALGDLNGDGLDDVVVGAPGWNASAVLTYVGRVHIFYAPGFSPSAATTLTPPAGSTVAGLWYGWRVAVGNLNGAGDPDPEVVVGAPIPTFSGVGRVYVYENASTATPSVATIFDPLGAERSFGKSLAIGDLDGDGVSDLAVGDPDYGAPYPGPYEEGRVHVFGGPSLALLYTLVDPTPAEYAHFGAALAIGDLTTDGEPDLLVGQSGSASGSAAAYLFSGGAPGTPPLVATLLPPSATGVVGGAFGTSLAIADLDGNGANDAVVGQSAPPSIPVGAAWVFYGSPGGAPLLGLRSRRMVNDSLVNLFGHALAAGDLTGNGTADLLVGSPESSKVWVFEN